MGIILNFEKDLFEKYYYILGHIIITIRFRNDGYYLEILKLDLFVKFYDMLGYNIIIERFGHKCNLMNNGTVAKFKFNGNIIVLERLAR